MFKFLANKKLLIGLIIIILAGAGGGSYFYIKGGNLLNPMGKEGRKKEVSQALKTWIDPLGFTFEYPKDLTIKPHEEDEENYAHVELVKKDTPGYIIIWVKDTTYTTLDEWINNDQDIAGGIALDTTWGGIEAKKVRISKPTLKVITATLYDNLIFLLEENPDKEGKLDEVYDAILGNFKFYQVSEKGETIPADVAPTSEGEESAGEGFVEEEIVE